MISPEVIAHTLQHQADLRGWAKGDNASEAGVELLIRAFDGRFATPGYPWIIDGEYTPAVDFEAIAGNLAGVADSERQFLMLVASIGGGRTRVDLREVIPGIDQELLSLTLAAIAHLSGNDSSSNLHEP